MRTSVCTICRAPVEVRYAGFNESGHVTHGKRGIFMVFMVYCASHTAAEVDAVYGTEWEPWMGAVGCVGGRAPKSRSRPDCRVENCPVCAEERRSWLFVATTVEPGP